MTENQASFATMEHSTTASSPSVTATTAHTSASTVVNNENIIQPSQGGNSTEKKMQLEPTAEELLLRSLPGLLDFADDFPRYPSMLPFVYKIYRDIFLSGLYENIEVLDGSTIDSEIYYFRGKIATNGTTRVLIPFIFDQTVDLAW